MNVRFQLALAMLLLVCFSCKKSNNSTTTSSTLITTVNIDSMKGYYVGTTSGDSIYVYTDTAGKKQQWVHTFTGQDTLVVTSPDTATITVSSKYYTISFPYGDSLTFSYVTNLQKASLEDNGYYVYNAQLTDTASGVNHMLVNVNYSYVKNIISNVLLYKR
jgi:hypothetical protein